MIVAVKNLRAAPLFPCPAYLVRRVGILGVLTLFRVVDVRLSRRARVIIGDQPLCALFYYQLVFLVVCPGVEYIVLRTYSWNGRVEDTSQDANCSGRVLALYQPSSVPTKLPVTLPHLSKLT